MRLCQVDHLNQEGVRRQHTTCSAALRNFLGNLYLQLPSIVSRNVVMAGLQDPGLTGALPQGRFGDSVKASHTVAIFALSVELRAISYRPLLQCCPVLSPSDLPRSSLNASRAVGDGLQ